MFGSKLSFSYNSNFPASPNSNRDYNAEEYSSDLKVINYTDVIFNVKVNSSFTTALTQNVKLRNHFLT